jgi:hypothetical protein
VRVTGGTIVPSTVEAAASGGVVYCGAIPTAFGTSPMITELPEANLFQLHILRISNDSVGTAALQIAVSVDNGASFGTPVVVSASVSAGQLLWGVAYVSQADAASSLHYIQPSDFGALGGSDPQAGAVNAIEVSWSDGSAFDAGIINVYAFGVLV